MFECVELARETAAVVSRRFDLPVYLYEHAAVVPGRTNLADIRRGGLDGLARRMLTDQWRPDFGKPSPHHTAALPSPLANG